MGLIRLRTKLDVATLMHENKKLAARMKAGSDATHALLLGFSQTQQQLYKVLGIPVSTPNHLLNDWGTGDLGADLGEEETAGQEITEEEQVPLPGEPSPRAPPPRWPEQPGPPDKDPVRLGRSALLGTAAPSTSAVHVPPPHEVVLADVEELRNARDDGKNGLRIERDTTRWLYS